MGGDDLDDDQLLWSQPVRGSDDEGDSDDDSDEEKVKRDESKSKKRKELSATTEGEPQLQSSSPKKQKSPAQLLLQAGRNIEQQDTVQQAAFLTTAVKHYSLLEQQQPEDGSTGDAAAATPTTTSLEMLPHFCLGQSTNKHPNCNTLVDRIREAVSVKKMKQWKNVGSPCVVIVCISARRAVALLKELAPLKVRTAKLFPKNGSVEEQRQQLASSSISIAVGTPHRLRQLADGDDNEGGRLSMEHTKLVIFDCHVSHKQFTVCTLPDTAPHCMALVRDCVLPQLSKRKDCKVAFL